MCHSLPVLPQGLLRNPQPFYDRAYDTDHFEQELAINPVVLLRRR
jgi:hypothetical protein